MTVQVETRKPADPFRKAFPTKWVLVCIALVIIAFFLMRSMRAPPAPAAPPQLPQAAPPPPVEPPVQYNPPLEGGDEPLNVEDLTEPEFPELDRELASVV